MPLKNIKKAFTLIELLFVVAIIIIIASVVLVMTISARKKAKDTDFKSVVNSAHKAYISECTKFAGANIASISLSGGVTRGATTNCNDGRFSVVLLPPPGVSSSCVSATVTHNGANFSQCP